MNRGNDVTEAMNGQNAAACSGEGMEGTHQHGTGGVLPSQGDATVPSTQLSPSTQISSTNPLQQFVVTGQVQQVQVQQMHPVQNVTLASPQQVTSPTGQPQQLLAGMMVVPQLSSSAGFQQVVSQSPTISASGHGTTTTALLLTPAQDARELQITRQTPTAPPVTQIQLAASFPATSTVSASGGTIHHHGQSPTRGTIPPLANPAQHQSSQQNLMASMNLQQQLAAAGIITSSHSGTQPALVSQQSAAGQQQSQQSTSVTSQGQPIRRLSSSGSLSPGAGSPRASPLLSFGPIQNTQRTSPIHSPERVRKRIKLEEVPPATPEIANYRKLICDEKLRQMKELKENYNENLSELFFLQTNGNYMDYHAWKKRPTVQLLNFLKSGNLDSDEDDETPVGTETKINDEKKNKITGIKALAKTTEAAPSISSPASQSQGIALGSTDPTKKLGGRHGMVFGHVQPTSVAPTPPLMPGGVPLISTPTTPVTTNHTTLATPVQQTAVTAVTVTAAVAVAKSQASASLSSTTTVSSSTLVTTPSHSSQLAKVMAEVPVPVTSPSTVKTTVQTTPSITVTPSTPSTPSISVTAVKTITRPTVTTPTSRLSTRQNSIANVYDTAIGSQEAIVERAKQEAQVMQRVAELRKEGLWSSRRLPKVQEPPRNKAHWDYLLEEMQWLAADFAQERKWKKAGARKIARMIMKYFQEQQQKELRAEKEEANRTKRIASNMAKMIKEFWSNIEKVVQYKQQSRLEEKRKKALDLHLSFIVDQTEKYSSWLTEGLQATGTASVASSSVPASPRSAQNDDDFEPDKSSESDDEETIAKAEKELDMTDKDTKAELDDLERESMMPLDELLSSLPKEILEKPASLEPSERGSVDESEAESTNGKDDKEFQASENSDDNEDTIAAQERKEKKADHQGEINDLEAENDLPIEELYKKYAAAYDEEFESQLSENSTDIDSGDSDEDEDEEEESEEEEEEDEEESTEEDDGEVGMEFLLNPESENKTESELVKEVKVEDSETKAADKTPSKDITDIAATAQSLQPTGYTLETTQVITPVPFLLKHSLREYQHVGLDWMATLHDRKLNGILADEMGLGKTIQTIALLAHLACEKEVWGPHLIVVPTSVMLNWEMEFKKWCPAFKILTYYGNQKERKLKRQGWTKTNAFHVCITSYKLVIQDHQAFRRKKWKYFILDEAQNIKNFKSQRWQTLLNFQSQRRLLLTGTPLQNSLMELWSLMHFLMPHVFASHREFKEWFSNPLSGMIEGSREYNENLIKRLHKVLRPFLLRRLKADVEKQMPKKYEHVIMCRLSKRQRFLYDDFMSQAKTKETLASGHFMSVINILMQLRKVCNHPNLFDPRPVLTPFQQEGITYTTASLLLRALEKDPLDWISPADLNPCLAQLEMSLPAFAAHRIRKLQTNSQVIREIDDAPDPAPRLKPLDRPAKLNLPRSQSLLSQASGKVSPGPQTGSNVTTLSVSTPTTSPAITASPIRKSTVLTHATSVLSRSGTPTRAVAPLQVLSTGTTPAAVTTTQLAQLPGHTPTTASLAQARMTAPVTQTLAIVSATPTSAGGHQQAMPITVQIHQTQQGTRLMIPSGQISQLPAGFIQIVQTASGQQIIAAQSTQGQALQVSQASQLVTNGPAATQASTSAITIPANTQVSSASGFRTTASLTLPTNANTSVSGKPVVRVSPLAQTPAAPTAASATSEGVAKPVMTRPGASTTTATTSSPRSMVTKSVVLEKKTKRKSVFYLESLALKRETYRKEKLIRIADGNKNQCSLEPIYGKDLFQAVNIHKDFRPNCDKTRWKSLGYLYCYDVHHSSERTNSYWRQTHALSEAINTPAQYLTKLKDILRRFVIFVPSVTARPLQMHASHPPPSLLNYNRMFRHKLHHELSPKANGLHPISTNMTIQCPEARLIQYDCGKLQTLDILLRQLKSGSHRVLIFTQMTKMLDVLEAFLNYHGHRYLRLDGTTHVEQRQVLMERFNMDKRIFVFILSTRSGGIGVNLTGADTVIFYDSDWNPTMDAQAQDRCHRIGQTRDVHIYRLISERTIEENILKKANQKRLMSDVAIEGGNFTTAFFKDSTIKELFAEPSGLDQLAKEKRAQAAKLEESAKAVKEAKSEPEPKPDLNNSMTQEQIEQALCNAEDETDVQAAKFVAAEQKAELAEFDENIPWDEKEEASRREEDDVSKVEQELAMLEKELTSVERYAVTFMEGQLSPLSEELERAEEEVALAKEEWEFNRLKELRAEEERRAELEEDEMLFTYSRQDAYNQVFICDQTGEQLPIWSPPTPPQDDNDVYIDQTICFLYEPTVMPESQLPPVYIKKEPKRPRVEAHVAGRKQKVRKDDHPRAPRSLFDRPNTGLRRDNKAMLKMKTGLPRLIKTQVPAMNRPLIDSPDQPEWLIHEDWALLQAVQMLLELPLHLQTNSPAHIPNWDLVADVVNTQSRTYRSPKQCKNRYENIIIPREEGKILYDINPRKQKKSKGIYKTKNNRPMKTSQLYVQDNNGSITTLYTMRFESTKSITAKRSPTLRPTLANPTLKNPKHAAVLAESGISYDTPMTPIQVATVRAERIAKEKKQQQAAAQEQLQQQQQQQQGTSVLPSTTAITTAITTQASATAVAPNVTAAVVTAAAAGQPQMTIVQGQSLTPVATTAVLQAASMPKGTVTAVSLPRSLGAAGSIVVNTAGGVPTNAFTTINKRVNQSGPIQVTPAGPSRTLTPQNISAAMGNQQRVAVTAGGTTQVITTTTLTPGTMVTRVATTTASGTPGTVQQALATTTRTLTPTQHLQYLRRAALIKQQQQQQQLRQQGRVPALQEQLKQQQTLKRLQAHAVQQAVQQQVASTTVVSLATMQKTVAVTTPLITSVAQAAQVTQARLQAPKQGIKRPFMDQQEMAALLRRQQLQQKAVISTTQSSAGAQQVKLAGAQILTGAQVQQVVASSSQPVATLVKTVSSPSGPTLPSVTIPVSAMSLGNVNISVSVPPHKASAAKPTPQQLRQIQQLQLQRKLQQAQSGHKVSTLTANQVQQVTKAQLTAPLIIQQQQQQILKQPVSVQQFQQLMQQQKAAQQQQQQQQQAPAAQTQGTATIQQIITSVAPPTTTATVIATQLLSQCQTQPVQTVTKVSLPMSMGTTVVSQPTRTTTHLTVTNAPSGNPVTVMSHGGLPTAIASPSATLSSSTVSLTPSQQSTLVKHVQDNMSSPNKTLPVTQATLAQLKAVQQVAVGRQVSGLTATSMQGQTVQLAQVQGVQTQIRGPSVAVQQAVQQVQAQAQQQRQQAVAAVHAAQAGSIAVSNTNTTMVQVTPQGQMVQTVTQAGAAGNQDPKSTQSSPYTMRLRNPPKHS